MLVLWVLMESIMHVVEYLWSIQFINTVSQIEMNSFIYPN